MYEQRYGIVDVLPTEGSEVPNMFGYASAHQCETLWYSESRYRDVVKRYLDNKIYEQTGIPFDRFLKQPVWFNVMMNELCAEKLAEAPKMAKDAHDKVLKEMEAIGKNNGGNQH